MQCQDAVVRRIEILGEALGVFRRRPATRTRKKIAEFCKRWNISGFAFFGSELGIAILHCANLQLPIPNYVLPRQHFCHVVVLHVHFALVAAHICKWNEVNAFAFEPCHHSVFAFHKRFDSFHAHA
jgi:hypothetical protein